MKNEIVKTKNGEVFEILDILTRQGNTAYLVCGEDGKTLILDPIEISEVLEEKKADFKTNIEKYLNIAEEVIFHLRNAFLSQEKPVSEKPVSENNNLFYDLEHLRKIRYEIINFSLVDMANYVDGTTYRNYDKITVDILEEAANHFEGWNATSVGNIAWIALHHHDHAVKTEAMILIERYRNYLKENELI